jgi:hypothetical protein
MENRMSKQRTDGVDEIPIVALCRCVTPSLRRSITSFFFAASLFLAALTGCKPASNSPGNQPATNAVTNAASAAPRVGIRTNLPAVARLLAKTNAVPAALRPPGKSNAAPPTVRSRAVTNAAPAVQGSNTVARIANTLRQLPAKRAFYPTVIVVFGLAALGFWLLKSKSKPAQGGVPSTPAAGLAKTRKAAIHCCNVLRVSPEARQIWQFDARGGGYTLDREQTSLPGEPLPAGLVARDWTSLWRRKLNIAWLPSEAVFLRVAQFPRSEFSETLAMVELQLEKLSPMPVAQIVWSIQVLPHSAGDLQTVIVIIAARSAVEEFLGQLEGQGYLADRLDLPMLDQLQSTLVSGDGAWIYPGAAGGKNAALVAWWCGGVLQSLGFLTLPGANRPAGLKEQLLQMSWAGEMEGWLTSAPRWHLVADASATADWEAPLREGLEQPVEVLAPVPLPKLAALNARRAAQAELQGNLLPAEFSIRYQQQFVDRLWMRGLAGVVVLYVVGVMIYGIAVGFATLRTQAVEKDAAQLSLSYTNALELKARCQVLKDRSELKFAALDCYQKVAELLPTDATLDGLNFSEGRRLTLNGTVPTDKVAQLLNDFEPAIRKAVVRGQPFFDGAQSENLRYQQSGPGLYRWECSLVLKRAEVQ